MCHNHQLLRFVMILLKINDKHSKQTNIELSVWLVYVCHLFHIIMDNSLSKGLKCVKKAHALRVPPSYTLGYMGSDYLYLPCHMINGTVILSCVYESIVIWRIMQIMYVYFIRNQRQFRIWYQRTLEYSGQVQYKTKIIAWGCVFHRCIIWLIQFTLFDFVQNIIVDTLSSSHCPGKL